MILSKEFGKIFLRFYYRTFSGVYHNYFGMSKVSLDIVTMPPAIHLSSLVAECKNGIVGGRKRFFPLLLWSPWMSLPQLKSFRWKANQQKMSLVPTKWKRQRGRHCFPQNRKGLLASQNSNKSIESLTAKRSSNSRRIMLCWANE